MNKEELFAVMEQIAEEREAARPIVRELVESGASVDDIEIPEGWRTAGMVMELCEFAYNHLEIDPLRSLSFSLLSLVLGTDPSTRGYPEPIPVYLEGRAWKEIGHSHRFMGAYDTAIQAQNVAETVLATAGVLIHEQMLTRFAQAGTLFRAERFALARESNAAAIECFRELGDSVGLLKSEVLDASIDINEGYFDVAREKFEKILGNYGGEDLYTLGIAYSNLAICNRISGRKSAAVMAAEHAREIFVELDMPSEVSRTDWGLATILLEEDPRKALPLLERLRADFLNRHMASAAGEIGLCIVDGLIATGRSVAALRLTEKVLAEFAEAKFDNNTMSALAYVRDLLQTTGDVRGAVREARSRVEKYRSEHQELFLSLDEAN